MKFRFNDKKNQGGVIRFLMVDNQQITFNNITQNLEQQTTAQGKLLDDSNSFEKMLNLQWDVILYHSAYDFTFEKALELVQQKGKSIPIILLSHNDPKSNESFKIYKLGIYDIVSPDNLTFLTLSLLKAVNYSRLIKKEQQLSLEIDKLQQQTQSLVETTEHAVAIFLEGVHVSANEQYAQLFKYTNTDELMELPLLDILKPEDITAFKQQFKKLTKGDFSHANFKIKSLNSDALYKELSLQFSATEYDDEAALQLVIVTETERAPKQQVVHTSAYASQQDILTSLKRTLNSSSHAALVLFVIDQIPDQIFNDAWNSSTIYLNEIHAALSLNIHSSILKISDHVFCTTASLDHENVIKTILANYLNKLPKQVNVNQQSIPVHCHISYTILHTQPDIDIMDRIIRDAFTQTFDATSAISLANSSEFTNKPILDAPSISFGEIITTPSTPAVHLQTHTISDNSERVLEELIETNKLNLSFQQIYDKEDIDTHIYEVTSDFVYNEKMISLEDFSPLRSNLDLALKVDRWVLVEASKRLHQFLSKCPKARIIVNLHSASLSDSNLVTLLTKLVNLINSKYTKPLILQFQEEDLLSNLETATKFIQSVQEYGVGITVSNFGQSAYGVQLLQQFDLLFVKLSSEFSQMLLNDDSMVELQEKLDSFKIQKKDAKFLLSALDDMASFANAWNVDVRYLEGSYFQTKHSEFIDNAG